LIFAKLDVSVYSHRRFAAAGFEAVGYWTMTLAYLRHQESEDGFLSSDLIGVPLGAGRERCLPLCEKLASVGLFRKVEDGYFLVHYAEKNETRDVIELRVKATRARKATYRKSLSRLPGTTLSHVPETTLSRVPETTLSRVPETTLSRVPETTLSRVPEGGAVPRPRRRCRDAGPLTLTLILPLSLILILILPLSLILILILDLTLPLGLILGLGLPLRRGAGRCRWRPPEPVAHVVRFRRASGRSPAPRGSLRSPRASRR
jgi:hypothetical protein